MPRSLSPYALLLLALALSSCADESTSPGAPGPDRPTAAGKGWALGKSSLDLMQADAYGMFLVHYPIALWLQYWLFDFNMPATVKAPIGFVLTVAFSWAITRALRQIPGAKRVL